MNEVGPKNVGTIDANQAYLVRPINDPSKFCQIPNYEKSVEEQIEEELDQLDDRLDNMGVFAANADTEDHYSAIEGDSESKKGADNESDEENLFDSDGKQNSEWSHGKLTKFATDNVNWATVSKDVSLLKSRRSECKTGFGHPMLGRRK